MVEAVTSRWGVLLSSALLLAAIGCKPEIGDDCTLSTDCSASGDRLCDTTQPGGYCTIFNCEPGSCPEEAICVGFNRLPSSNPDCEDPLGSSRFFRSFCMVRCDGNGDCRDGYVCMDMGREGRDKLGAVVLERPPVNGKVCTVRPRDSESDEPQSLPDVNVCGGPGGAGGTGQGGAAGASAGGMSGAAGAGAFGGGGSAGLAGAFGG